MQRTLRIALTGGPGGGKTTAVDMFRREIGERIVVVPEAATMLFSGGFPRVDDVRARRSSQAAIYHVQRNLEDVQAATYPGRILLCDRGALDGVVYWPDSREDFFEAMNSNYEAELERYDAVLFFESAAVGHSSIEGGNPQRIETLDEARALDAALREVWAGHPNFFLIPHNSSFIAKIVGGLHLLHEVLERLGRDLSRD